LDPVYLFKVAARQADWLSVRQSTVSGNISNVNTPGYKARDVLPFDEVMDRTRLTLAATDARHFNIDEAGAKTTKVGKGDSWEVVHSGNSVSVEQEMLKASEINRAYSLNTNIVRSFHRMYLMSVKGS
jgi:Flagellar basal body protein